MALVPKPSTIALLAIGAIGLVLGRRRFALAIAAEAEKIFPVNFVWAAAILIVIVLQTAT